MKVLSVMAHPDDEVIFGWPIMQNAGFQKQLIMLVSDRDNPERQWCAQRLDALAEICAHYDIALTCLHFDSEFYRTPYRRAELVMNDVYDAANSAIDDAMRSFCPDLVFTHNPHGEYGMFDHRIVFDIVSRNTNVPNLCVTDIAEVHQGWPSRDEISGFEYEAYYQGKPCTTARLTAGFYVHCKSIYDAYGCWTWRDFMPPDYPKPSCGLYLLRREPGFDLRRFEHLVAQSGDPG